MGVPSTTNEFAVLCRLNWLPLSYVLAIQSICWLYRITKIPGSDINQMFLKLRDDPTFDEYWGDSLFFKPAHDMLKRFELIYNRKRNSFVNFYEVPNVVELKKLLKKSAFYEFNSFWKSYTRGRYTYNFFPSVDGITKRLSEVTFNRKGERLYYTFSFQQNLLNYFWYVIVKKGDRDLCRFCKKVVKRLHIY